MIVREAFDYAFSRLDPTGAHIDPPHIAVYELLMTKGRDRRPEPAVARSWTTSADGLTWRLELVPGLRFHSGEPCDAAAVVEALDALRHDFPQGQLWYWDPVDEVRPVGAATLEFTLHHPYARLPSLLWGTHSTIYNQRLRARDPARHGHDVADGTGPFRLRSWSPERIVVERSASYHGAAPRVDGIEWLAILDESSRLEALESDAVHIIHGPPPGEVDRLATDERFNVYEFVQASTFYLGLDWTRTELGFDDLRVRKAISLALDREAIVRAAFAGRGAAVWGPVPPSDEHYDPTVDAGRGQDLQQAHELLRAARGDEPLQVDCLVQDDEAFRRIAAVVQAQLAGVGVHLRLRYETPFLPFYDACAAGPPAFISKWLWPDAIDAVIGFASSRCDGFPNYQHSAIPALDESFRMWLRATDDELHACASRVQHIAADELPYVPLVTPNDVWVTTKQLHGFHPHPSDLYPRYNEMWLGGGG
jgi:ABC-type transport system substrate-binding protein